MARLRLLADTPEGAPGCVVVVSASRARDLVALRWAEPVRVDKQPHRDRKARRAKG